MRASEFGGSDSRTGVQPAPHEPTASEKLSLGYRTGDETNGTLPDNGEAFAGILPTGVQTAARKAEGVLDRGQVWRDMLTASQAPKRQKAAPK